MDAICLLRSVHVCPMQKTHLCIHTHSTYANRRTQGGGSPHRCSLHRSSQMEHCSPGSHFVQPCRSASISCERSSQPPPQPGCCRKQSRLLQTWSHWRQCLDVSSRSRSPRNIAKAVQYGRAVRRANDERRRPAKVEVPNKCWCLCMQHLFQVT